MFFLNQFILLKQETYNMVSRSVLPYQSYNLTDIYGQVFLCIMAIWCFHIICIIAIECIIIVCGFGLRLGQKYWLLFHKMIVKTE